MTDTTKAPHCPRCGSVPKPPMRFGQHSVQFYAPWCEGCGFHEEGERGFGTERDAVGNWTKAVRAELARQALEMRTQSIHTPDSYTHLSGCMSLVIEGYEHLGTHPLRLPGEEA